MGCAPIPEHTEGQPCVLSAGHVTKGLTRGCLGNEDLSPHSLESGSETGVRVVPPRPLRGVETPRVLTAIPPCGLGPDALVLQGHQPCWVKAHPQGLTSP